MRAVIQRVRSASVTVGGEAVSSIGRGLCVLVGLHRDDGQDQLEYIVRKLVNLRLFEDPESGKRWSKSVKDLDLEILCVSQFTLYHQLKGNKPDYRFAMGGDESKAFYARFMATLRTSYKEDKVHDGLFGAMMDVSLVNDGPVTLQIESEPKSLDDETAGD